MRVFAFANNWLGWQGVRWLVEQGEEIVGVAVHPAHRQKHAQEIIAAAGLKPAQVFDGSTLAEPNTLRAIGRLEAEMGVSLLFGYILRPSLIDLLPRGIVNLHLAYLPFNRGAYPNVWSIVDGTPAGVTMHLVDSGIDTGPILAQKSVVVEPIDTGETLYRKLERAGLDLLMESWKAIRNGRLHTIDQPAEGTSHRVSDVARIDEIDLDGTYRARDLINVLRARTFGDYPGAFFRHEGRKVFMRLHLMYDCETADADARERIDND